MTEWYANGEPATTMPLGDRSMLYGDGLFETVAIRDGQPRLWSYHMDRLGEGCERLGIEMPGIDRLESELGSALAATSLSTSSLTGRLTVTAGTGPRGYRRPADQRSCVYLGLTAAAKLDRVAYSEGVGVRLCSTRLAIQPSLAGLKTLNRLEQVLAREEWSTSEFWEGLMFDADDNLICGTMSNVFLVDNNTVLTPGLDRSGVAGVMRRHVSELLADDSLELKEKTLTIADVDFAEEIFLTNSQVGAVPVASLNGRTLKPGIATRHVQALLAANGVPECAQ